jgi:hypothetical protein
MTKTVLANIASATMQYDIDAWPKPCYRAIDGLPPGSAKIFHPAKREPRRSDKATKLLGIDR